MKEIQTLYSKFKIVGVPKINKEKFYGEGKSSSGYVYSRINFGVKTSDSNVVFVEMMGGFFENNAIIKSKNEDGKEIEIKWENRFNEDVLNDIPSYRKRRISLGENKENEFLSDYDAVNFLHNNLKEESRIVATGNIVTQRYKDKNGKYQVNKKYIINNVRLAFENEENEATCVCKFVFDSDAWDDGALEETKKIYINAYDTVKDKDLNCNIFIPVQFVIDCANVDFNNPDNVAFLEYYKECFNTDMDVIKETEWHGNIVRGAEEIELTEDDLSDAQKVQIQLGIATKEDFVKDMRGSKIKNKVNEIRLIRPTNTYDGAVSEETDYNEEDFFIPESKQENLSDVLGGKNKESDDEKGQDLASKLFGGK